MEPTSTASIKVARWLVAVLAVANVIRAITLSVTVGEAWNYDRFIQPPWRDALAHFDLNNHVLNTLLVRISTHYFHLTELSLRLPSVLAGFLYLWVVYRLVERRFGSGWQMPLIIGLLTLNPLVLNAMSEARGYGMALACMVWALELMLELAESFSAPKFNLAAVLLGLSISASLAFAAPAVALATVFLAWGRGWLWPRGKGLAFGFLIFLPTFVFLVIPIDHVTVSSFAGGATSLRQTLNEISAISLGTSTPWVMGAVRIGVGILAAVCLIAAIRFGRHRWNALLVLTAGTFPLTLGILLAAHRWLHAPFPSGGALYLVPISTLALTALFLKRNTKSAKLLLYAGGILLIARYVTATDIRTYAGNEEFAGGRALAKALRTEVGLGGIDLGASKSVEPIVNYYRTRLRQGNWERVPRQPPTGSYAYYVLAGPDRALVEERQLKVVYQDAGLILARRP
jgi:hypothetical protein